MPLPSRLFILTFLAAVPITAPRAQSCEAVTTHTAPGELSGRRIDSVAVVTLAPDPLPGPAAMMDGLHVRTQAAIIRRQLAFAPGDTVDTLVIADALRRLRARRYLSDAWVVARPCDPNGGVALTVTTRDTWSTRPEVKFGSSGGATVGLTERNLFGTGRAASVYVRSASSRLGVGAMLSDPWVPHTNLAATVRLDSYRDGTGWLATAATHRFSIFDPWQTQLLVSGTTYHHGAGDTSDVFVREEGALLVSHGVHASSYGVTSLIAGVELARSRLSAGPALAILGPDTVRRDFVGLDLGVRRESASYDTLSWMLPAASFAEVPRGFEGELVTGFGTDFVSRLPAMRVDLWGGRVWSPGSRDALVTDLWVSGFVSGGLHAGSVRAHGVYYRAAPRGLWIAQVAGERLFDPDPDVRALGTLDPALPLFPSDSRIAELALSAAVERDVHLRVVSRNYAVDGAVFSAFSWRHDPPPMGPNASQLYAGVVGLGLRLAPTRAGRATFRLDLGFPVARSPQLRGRPYIGVMIMPWLGGDRERDGRRER